MKATTILYANWVCLLAVSYAPAQGDFFFSFLDGGPNVNQSASFQVGDTGSLYVYWSTNGPADADLSIGAMIDVLSDTEGVIEFTAAETFDYVITFQGTPISNRWLDANGGNGSIGPAGNVEANYIEMLTAFSVAGGPGILEANNGSGDWLDSGYDAGNDGFNYGRIDFNVVGTGSTNVTGFCENGDCTPWVHNKVITEFSTATITVSECLSGYDVGDVNQDGAINLLDVDVFVTVLTNGGYFCEADIDQNGSITLQDVDPFVALLLGQ